MADEDEDQAEAQGVSVVGAPSRRPSGSSARQRGGKRRSSTEPSPLADATGIAVSGSWTARAYRRLPMGASLALIGVTLVSVVSAIVFGVLWAGLSDQNSATQVVKQKATTFLLDLTNFRPTTIDADFAEVQNFAVTGSVFAKQAAQTLNSSIRQALIQNQSYSQGQIRNVFVESLNGPNAEVYAVVDQAYQNSKMTSPTTDTLRVTLNMQNTSQGWRIAAVTVENPSGTPTVPSSSSTTTTVPGK